MSILAWNIQDIASKGSQCILKDLCCRYKLATLVLVETKTSGPHVDAVCLNMGLENWFKVEAIGLSSGIWVFWNSSVGTISLVSSHPQFLQS